MKYRSTLFFLCACAIALAICLISCSADEAEVQTSKGTNLQLHLVMERADYGTTRADVGWQDGERVYLQFTVGAERVVTWADYDAAEDIWKLDAATSASLTAQTIPSCEAFSFVDAESLTSQRVNIGAHTIIFADEQAKCEWNEEERTIIVKGTLAPLTTRLRLVGEAGRSFSLSGLTRYTAYNAAANSFTASTAALTGTIGAGGSSDYLYVLLADESKRQLTLDAEGSAAYVRTFTASEFQPGKSGWLTLPTTQNMGRWQMVNIVNGREITLPKLSETTMTTVGSRSASPAAVVTDAGNGTILDAGFYVAESADMTVFKTFPCGEKTKLAVSITGLKAETTYFVRPFARNERGAATGNLLSFTTTEEGTVELDDFSEDENWEDAQTTQGDIMLDDFDADEPWDDYQNSQGEITQDDFTADEDWN